MSAFHLGLVIPLRGPGGIYGPACQAVSELAVAEINRAGGMLGREVELHVIDAGQPLAALRRELGERLARGAVHALCGWHTSAVRNAIVPVVAARIPYSYPAAYEGEESRPGVYVTGEVPSAQLVPALARLRAETGASRWFVVGDDYAWPRSTFAVLRARAVELGIEFVGASFLAVEGDSDARVRETLASAAASGAHSVLVLMVGQNAVRFNRAFAAAGLDERMTRLSSLMEENMLMASGARATRNLFSTGGWFRSLVTGHALDFSGRYARAVGPHAPAVGAAAEACYESILALHAILRRAGSAEVAVTDRVVDGTRFEGPRGDVAFVGNHASQTLYLARADHYDFELVAEL
ncbi:substrate-binding domain-containing protein [Galbitalea soli]|uniref:ABC transporter substrate-binding protein n=1 Tax=Galbitalea soli TaxID=1268042 RepID=A0A7C9TNU6_9MICO|nr:substrate-binding domain-containing protein [Galbitalea soli]NEM89939.1 ABC transporter substrate-binding protein [Galbitalea soli]NYJ30645.1 ABC-type branched-subunit amino acid transport system substrate-binding protein [Galbitalea soli]